MEAATAQAAGVQPQRRSRGVPERRLAWYMVSPSLVLIALVAAYPIVYAVWLSLHQYSLINAGEVRWALPNAPFGNYTDALWGEDSKQFWTAFRTTFVFTIASVAARARDRASRWRMAMHAAFKGQGILRTVSSSRGRCSPSSRRSPGRRSSSPSSGFVNTMLGAIGLPDDTSGWARSPRR